MFRFPTADQDRRDKWIVRVGRKTNRGERSDRRDGLLEPKVHDRLCSDHFVSGKPSSQPEDIDFLPSLFQHTPLAKTTPQILKMKSERQNRAKGREENTSKSAAALALLELSCNKENLTGGVGCQASVQTKDCATQTELELHDMDCLFSMTDQQREVINTQETLISRLLDMTKTLQAQFNSIDKEFQRVLSQYSEAAKYIDDLEKKVKLCFSYKFIENNDSVTSYYTGLPNYATFETVFQHTVKHVKRKNTKLSLKDELLLTLFNIRHNPGMEEIGYRFGISRSTANKIFNTWLNALNVSLSGLVAWPPIDKDLELPEVFRNKKFCKVRCVIDCTEIFIERPKSLKARAQTYSNYKKHNTVKILISTSASGAVTFISEVWGGRVSDRKITIESGILDKFVPGDSVMADRGFNMKDDFAQRGVNLIIPAFTRGKKQLSPVEVEESRQMSRARIHVERVIGRIKDFKILSGCMQISFVKGKDRIKKVLNVIGAIVNMNKPLL